MHIRVEENGEVTYHHIVELLDEFITHRERSLGYSDIAIVGDVALQWWDKGSVDTLSGKVEIIYSDAKRPPPNLPWLSATRATVQPRHVAYAEFIYYVAGSRYKNALPMLKLGALRKLYTTPPQSAQRAQYAVRTEVLMERKRQRKLAEKEKTV